MPFTNLSQLSEVPAKALNYLSDLFTVEKPSHHQFTVQADDSHLFLSVLKSSHGSANFSVLGNRSMKNENSPSGEKQVGHFLFKHIQKIKSF